MDEKDFFVTTDIHGCYKSFMALMKAMGVTDQDTLLNLGDAVDRGPRIREVLDYLMNRPNTINVLGNHDYYAIDYGLNGLTHNNMFMYKQGLQETVAQLGSDFEKYARWMQTWEKYVTMPEPAPYVFCHASYPWRKSDKGVFTDLHLWERFYYDDKDSYVKYDGPVIVHGHTPTKNPYEFIGKKLIGINLDGGCCYKGPNAVLRGMRLSDGKIFEVPYSD